MEKMNTNNKREKISGKQTPAFPNKNLHLKERMIAFNNVMQRKAKEIESKRYPK